MNEVDNIRKGQLLYVVLEGQTRVRTVEVVDIRKNCDKNIDPLRYMDIVVQYMGSKTNGTVTFFPEDFGEIIFVDEYDASKTLVKQINQRSKNGVFSSKQEHDECVKKDHVFQAIVSFCENEKNWEKMKNYWHSHGCFYDFKEFGDFKELLRKSMGL